MSRRERSPIRLEHDREVEAVFKQMGIDEKHVLRWVCDEDRLAAAQFNERGNAQRFAVLHRTTKPGSAPWQVSFFDERGPVGDAQARTCALALRDHIAPHVYRIRAVETRKRR